MPMRDGTRGGEDEPGPRRGQSPNPPTAPMPSTSPSTSSPTFSTPAATSKSAKPSAIDERRERRRKRRRQAIIATTIVGIVVLVGSIGTVSYAIISNLAGAEQPAADPAPEAPAVAEPLVFPEDEPAATAGAEPCATVNVLSSFENAEMVEGLAAAYNSQPRNVAGSCVTVTTSREKSGVAAAVVATGFPNLADDQKPTVWLPDSSTWVDVAQAAGATNLRAEGTSV